MQYFKHFLFIWQFLLFSPLKPTGYDSLVCDFNISSMIAAIQVVPKDNGDSLPVPTPEPSPQLTSRRAHSHGNRSHHHHHRGGSSSRRVYPRANSDVSLSTISEEPTQYSSHEIVVQPEVVVETTTSVPGSCGHDGAHHQQQLSHPHRTSGGEGGSRVGGARGSDGSVATASTAYTDVSALRLLVKFILICSKLILTKLKLCEIVKGYRVNKQES